MVLPTLSLIKQLLARKEGESDLTTRLKSAMLTYMEEKLTGDAQNLVLYKKASFLDPRFKMKYADGATKAALAEEARLDTPGEFLLHASKS